MDQPQIEMKKTVKFGKDNPVFIADGDVPTCSVSNQSRSASQESIVPLQLSWDVFEETPVDNFAHHNPILEVLWKILLKTLTGVFLFVFVLGTALISRLTLLEMVQQVRLVNIPLSLTDEQQNKCHLQPKSDLNGTTTPKLQGTNHSSSWRNNSTSRGNSTPYVPPVLQVHWIWALFLVICFPYCIGILNNLWKIIFKKTASISKYILLWTILIETLHSLGLLMLIFIVLTSIDPVRSSMLIYGVGLVPCILDVFPARNNDSTTNLTRFNRLFWKVFIIAVAIFIIILLIFFYRSLKYDPSYPLDEPYTRNPFYIAPISLVLISVKYWSLFSERVCSGEFEKSMNKRNTKIFLLVSMLKIGFTLLFVYVFYGTGSSDCSRVLFVRGSSTNATSCGLHKVTLSFSDFSPESFIYASVNIIAGFICFRFARTACQLLAQRTSFSLPLVLTGPFSTFLVLFFASQGMPFLKMTPKDAPPLIQTNLKGFLSCYYYKEFTLERIFVIGFYLSFLFVTRHVWVPKVERLAKDDKLFTSTIYCGALLDQSIMLSRRRDEKKTTKLTYTESTKKLTYTAARMKLLKDDPLIYACATMWHETENEMIQLLKSIFRMDLDQATRAYMKDNLGTNNDYYEFEAHIFFDDAFKFDVSTATYVLNNYVKQLLKCVPEACRAIHTDIEINLPRKIFTPYGGRLEWDMPGANKMIAHLKNKKLIRPKKRWSQVMYMYYFLGQRIFAEKVSRSVKATRSENTFLLALDGDVDFEPSAVLLLVDRMKRNPKVGAACGRIHPIGTGPMVWYQKFEYAISHWLQKATEHMIGCVLCSPGCFSLFRGSALGANNVLKRYTTRPSEAKHHVQYDQGEDRWLCTLLLQQGYRVEYCAASDALTYCPETFNEFYKQRRRWAPSTMANIMDLLMDWRNVRRKNDSISLPYIFYQSCLMVTSILTPGTIFMLIVGALHTAYDISLTNSLIVNLVPVVLMLLLCFFTKEDIQLQYASVMSLLYALFMMLVLVGLMKEIGTYLFCSFTTILFFFVTGTFILSAICHPQELFCLMHGLLYFLLIPSMSILLIFYGLGNLHNVSWGTRDSQAEQVVKAKEAEQIAKAKAEVNQSKTRRQSTIDRVHNFFTSRGSSKNSEMESEYNFSCGSIFRCLCFPKENSKNKEDLLEPLLNRFDNIVRMRSFEFAEMMKTREVKKQEASSSSEDGDIDIKENSEKTENEDKSENVSSSNDFIHSNPLYNPEWMDDEALKDMDTDDIDEVESNFWKNLIDQYLFPFNTDEDVIREEKMKENLLVLRNNVCLFFSLINALFVMVVFTIEFSLSNSSSTSFNMLCQDSNGVRKDTNTITIVFMLVFGITLFVQLVAMLFHRYETFMHILASIDINPKMMSKMDTDNFWRLLSAGDRDHSEGESFYSELTESVSGDAKSTQRHQRHFFKRKKKKLQSLKEKMDKKFSAAYDNVQENTDVPAKGLPVKASHMSWMLMLQDPEIKAKASQHREYIRNKWKLGFTLAQPKLANIVNQLKLAEKNSRQQSTGTNHLNTTLLEDSTDLSLTALHEDQPHSEITVERRNSMLVSVIVHSDKSTYLELDNQEGKDIDQQDSSYTYQRDPEADQNGIELIVVQEKESKTASAFLKQTPDTLASLDDTDAQTHSQGETVENGADDMSVSSEHQWLPDNKPVSSGVLTDVMVHREELSSDAEGESTTL